MLDRARKIWYTLMPTTENVPRIVPGKDRHDRFQTSMESKGWRGSNDGKSWCREDARGVITLPIGIKASLFHRAIWMYSIKKILSLSLSSSPPLGLTIGPKEAEGGVGGERCKIIECWYGDGERFLGNLLLDVTAPGFDFNSDKRSPLRDSTLISHFPTEDYLLLCSARDRTSRTVPKERRPLKRTNENALNPCLLSVPFAL